MVFRFYSFSVTLVRFSIKINDFGSDFHKISLIINCLLLQRPAEISLNAMVIWKWVYQLKKAALSGSYRNTSPK